MADTATAFNGSSSSINNNNNNGNGNVNGNGSIRPKVQIRTNGINGSSFNEKSPSPAAKLLISHGKPNFTIPRTNKSQEQDAANPLSPTLAANNNYNAYKTANSYSNNTSTGSSFNSNNIIKNNNNNNNNNNNTTTTNNNVLVGTKFNGVFKPTSIALAAQPSADTENEASKVVLRRPRQPEPVLREHEDENVPEFIRRQRRIQERLAKENVLDFENRRSGYFTHMMISPDSPNRTSFVETMSSPAIVPALEIPPPTRIEEEKEHEVLAAVTNGQAKEPVEVQQAAPPAVVAAATQVVNEVQQLAAHKVQEQTTASNGHSSNDNDDVEADVAQAIEEVNKAVAGEDEPETEAEVVSVAAVTTAAAVPTEHTTPATAAVDEALAKVDAAAAVKTLEVAAAPEVVAAADVQVHAAAAAADAAAPPANGHAELNVAQQNGHTSSTTNGHATDEITISHTNGSVATNPSIPTPDPSGALGVNFEPKTVVSFAQELGSGENKYPDTVKVLKDGELVEKPAEGDNLQAMTKLKFDITGEQNDVQVTPVLKTE